MDNEAAWLKAYNTETQDLVKQYGKLEEGGGGVSHEDYIDNFEQQIFASFVKEHEVIMNYVYDLVLFAAKINSVGIETIFLSDA